MTSRGICQSVGVSSRKGEHFPFWAKKVRTKIKPAIYVNAGKIPFLCSVPTTIVFTPKSGIFPWQMRISVAQGTNKKHLNECVVAREEIGEKIFRQKRKEGMIC